MSGFGAAHDSVTLDTRANELSMVHTSNSDALSLFSCQQNLLGSLQTGHSSGVRKQSNAESDPTDLSEIAVLIAHSDPVISAGLAALLRKSGKFKVLCYRWKRATVERTRDPVDSADVVIADYDSGIRLTVTASELNRRVVILTDSDGEAKICRAFAQGVRGYLLLGCSLEDLMAGIRSVHEGGVAVTPRVASRIAESLNQATLTARELSVLRQMTLGQSNRRIAQEFGLAEGTVKTHVKSILSKLNAGNRGEAVAITRRRGILPDEVEWQAPGGTRGLPRLAQRNEGPTPRNGAACSHFLVAAADRTETARADPRVGSAQPRPMWESLQTGTSTSSQVGTPSQTDESSSDHVV